MRVAAESAKSLHVRGMRRPLDGGSLRELTQGSAFVVEHQDRWFLVTNMHVLTGRDPVAGKPTGTAAAMPETLAVWHNSADGLGHWVQVNYELYDEDGRARWYEHPASPHWDLVAIQIAPKPELIYIPYEFTTAGNNTVLEPGADLSIIGFPFGTSSDGRFAIWSRATVASDPDLDYSGRPTFLVDSRSRDGQSGSPVIFRSDSARYENGSISIGGSTVVQLFGIYSGRISDQSDLGIVWKSEAIRELVENRSRSSRQLDEESSIVGA